MSCNAALLESPEVEPTPLPEPPSDSQREDKLSFGSGQRGYKGGRLAAESIELDHGARRARARVREATRRFAEALASRLAPEARQRARDVRLGDPAARLLG
jgi:hypothetical protein